MPLQSVTLGKFTTSPNSHVTQNENTHLPDSGGINELIDVKMLRMRYMLYHHDLLPSLSPFLPKISYFVSVDRRGICVFSLNNNKLIFFLRTNISKISLGAITKKQKG